MACKRKINGVPRAKMASIRLRTMRQKKTWKKCGLFSRMAIVRESTLFTDHNVAMYFKQRILGMICMSLCI